MTSFDSTSEHYFDVVIIGAGISGINSAYRLQTQATKGTTYTILENRADLGGTWDLFKYPGIRSDSDLYTFGFTWYPWTHGPPIAEAKYIVSYMKQAVAHTGIDKNLNFGHEVLTADWSSKEQQWSLKVQAGEVTKLFRSKFVIFGTGYYDYKTPLKTQIHGLENFNGPVIHPQFWPTDLDYTNKKVALIGSGATAITIFPVVAKTAKHITLVQRSPSYVVGSPNQVGMITRFFSRWIPRFTYFVQRMRILFQQYWLLWVCRNYPTKARTMIQKATVKLLPATVPHDPHFRPSYNPWEQRMCLAPDGDFYVPLREGKASIVTGTIKTVTESGLIMDDGQEIAADIIVTATGLKLQFGGHVAISIDGQPYNMASKFIWKSMMPEGLPNAITVLGYTNASWTLGADVAIFTFIRIMKAMEKKHASVVVARSKQKMEPKRLWDLTSTYVHKASGTMPVAGDRGPWKARQGYFWDLYDAQWGTVMKGLDYIPTNSHIN